MNENKLENNLKDWQQPLVKFGAIIAIGFITGAWVLGSAISNRNAGESVSVTGSASKIIESDHASWSIYLTRQGKTPQQGYASLNKDLEAVKAFLKDSGVDEKDVSINPLSSSPYYTKNSQGYDTNVIDGYRLTQNIVVENDKPDQIESLSRDITKLITQGVQLESGTPQYYCTQIDGMKVEMLKAATKNAYERGKGIAESSGRSLGVLKSADAGVFQITPKTSTEVSDYGVYDTSSKEKKMTSVVNASFTVR